MKPTPAGTATTVHAYDAAAEGWDRGLGSRSPQFAARMRATILRLLQPAAGTRLGVELGAGTGWMLDATAPLFAELRAIEPSAAMLAVCRRRVEALGLANVRTEAGDAQSLEGIGDASVDAIYAIGVLDAVAAPERVFAAAARVLKRGGLFVVATSNGDCPWFRLRDRLFGRQAVRTGRYLTRTELIRIADRAGLRAVEVATWGGAPPRLALVPAVALLDVAERALTRLHLARYLAVLTASFRKG